MKTAQSDNFSDVRKIVVFRPNALGDFVFCLPALHALKLRYPEARITFVGKQWHSDFLAGRPGPIDELVVMPPFPGIGAPVDKPPVDIDEDADLIAGRKAAAAGGENNAGETCAQDSSRARAEFIERMRAEHFDLAIQLYGGGRFANPLVKQFGARYCIGMRAPDAELLDRWLPFDGVVNKRLQLLEVAALADAAAWPMHARMYVTVRDRAAASACFADSAVVPPVLARFASTAQAAAPEGLHAGTALLASDAPSTTDARISPSISQQPLVLLQPGSTDPRRCWPAQKFAILGDALAARGARIYINGTTEEASLVASIVAAMHYPAIDLSGKASLSALCGLIELCSLVVSNDTGPLHLALEIGTPAVGIYWLTNLIESAPLRQQGHRAVVSLQVHCSICGAENITTRCAHDPSFVADVGLEEVLAHALALLELT